jgi:hypothetical protein
MIPRMLVIVPTRGRPENVARLEKAREETGTTRADFLYIVDHDDPEAVEYAKLELNRLIILHERLRLGGTLNWAARKYAGVYDAIGFMGDDHLPRTESWDLRILEALDVGAVRDPRVVYGNDLLQGENLPTAVFMHSRIIQALGYFCPPDQVHLYLDNFWKELGQELNGLVYLPDVVIEHMHPVAGKAAWDERYAEVNSPDVDNSDKAAWLAYRGDGRFITAVERVQKEYAR